ncbi:MAG: response regulator [Breznakibacter sp.]
MNPIRVAVIDDNETWRDAFCNILCRQLNLSVIENSDDPYNLLESVNLDETDLIFMDIRMPMIDGITLAKKLLLQKNSLKIIAVTMYIDSISLALLLSAGFKGCISKASLLPELESATNTVLEGRLYFPRYIVLSNYPKPRNDRQHGTSMYFSAKRTSDPRPTK